MNAAAANALYEAERRGVRQIKGQLWDGQGGFCAMGVIERASGWDQDMTWQSSAASECPLCGATEQDCGQEITNERILIVHLNNDHGLTFAEIARKLGPDSV